MGGISPNVGLPEGVGLSPLSGVSGEGISKLPSSVPYVGPLDLVPGAVVAFDQFAPSAAWLAGTNNYMLLKRDSDNDEEQFQYAADGSAPIADIASWLGEANAVVMEFSDGSGNNKHLTPGEADPPEWVASVFGSIPAVRCDNGAPSSLVTGSSVNLSTSQFTVACVFRNGDFALNSNWAVCGENFDSEAGDGHRLTVRVEGQAPTNKLRLQLSDGGSNRIGGVSTDGTDLSGANSFLVLITCERGSREFRINGAAQAVTSLDLGSGGIGCDHIFGFGCPDGDGFQGFNGDLAVVYFWPFIATGGQISAVETLLMLRYGIS